MKIYILIVFLMQATLFSQSEFMKMCENPTPSQKLTLEIMAEKKHIGEYSKELCRKIERKYQEASNIFIFDTQLNDLTPLQYFTQIKSAHIQRNNISDITPLSKLTNLEELELRDNPISDITPLQNLKLKKLTLTTETPIDLSPLSKLKTLKSSHFYGRNEELPNLNKLINSESLSIHRVNISSLCLFKNSKN